MVGQIHRSVDGRFVLSDSSVAAEGDRDQVDAPTATVYVPDEVGDVKTSNVPSTSERRNSTGSQNSSSDDGGFLSRRNILSERASWRRPLVASPSQLSLQSNTKSARGFLQGLGGLLRVGGSGGGGGRTSRGAGARYQNVYRHPYGYNIYRNLQTQPGSRPLHQKLHINTISGGSGGVGGAATHLNGPITPNLYTPSRISRIFSSSPASTIGGGGGLTSPWTTSHHQHFSDLSTVYPSSGERSFPTQSSGNLSRYRYYANELPSLRTIQEETRRMNQQQHGFVPLHVPSPPSWRGYYHTQTPYHSYRPRTRWYPRHHSRLLARSQSELLSPLPHLNLSMRSGGIGGLGAGMGLEASPESRSSSSGFGSKNTSNQQHGSHHSGSTSEWRLLPPYRPPPPPPSASYLQLSSSSAQTQHRQQAQAQEPILHSYPHHHHHHHHHHQHQLYLQQQKAAQHALFDPSAATRHAATLPYYHHQYPATVIPEDAAAAPANTGTNSSYYSGGSVQRPPTPPYTMGNWLDMISRLNAATDTANIRKAVDVGSVDGHYEFDPSTPTPSASTPTGGPRDDLNLLVDADHHLHHGMVGRGGGEVDGGIFHTTASGIPLTMPHMGAAGGTTTLRKPRICRYDNTEARLQAMKEEFYAYRKRQAMKRAGVGELESIC